MNVSRLALAAAAASLLAAASPAAAQSIDRPVSAYKHASASDTYSPYSPWKVALEAGSGVGVFQDIQVPVNQDVGLRGDGTVAQQEDQNHTGLPIRLNLGVDYQSTPYWSFQLLHVDAMQIRALTGPAESQSSSYSRLGLTTGAAWHFGLLGMTGSVGADAGFRRSSFNNVSSSHYVEGALVGGSLGLAGSKVNGQIFARTAPYARFGYSEAGFFGGKPFGGSTATLSDMGINFAFPLRPGVWLDTGVERESAHVTIADVNVYNSFGLNVQDTAHPNRVYDLETSVAKFGVRKDF